MEKPLQCKGCPLYEQGLGPVAPQLPIHYNRQGAGFQEIETPAVCVLVDAPNFTDYRSNTLLSDPIGRLTRVWLKEAGVKSSAIYITAMCKCASGAPVPIKAAVHCYNAFGKDELEKYKDINWIFLGRLGCELLLQEEFKNSIGYTFKHPMSEKSFVTVIPTLETTIKNPRETGGIKRLISKGFRSDHIENPTPFLKISPSHGQLIEFFMKINRGTYFVFDTETMGLEDLRMTSISITAPDGETLAIGMSPQVKNLLPIIFENSHLKKYAYNVHFDMRVMKHAGIKIVPGYRDIKRMVHLDDIGTASQKLAAIAPVYLNINPWKEKAGEEGLLVYNAKDSYFEWRVLHCVIDSLKGTRRWELWEREEDLDDVICGMMDRGFLIDLQKLYTKQAQLKKRLIQLEIDWIKKYGDVNVNSQPALLKLFESKGIQLWKTHKGTLSTEEPFLRLTKARYPEHANLFDDIIQFRYLKKMQSTYLESGLIPSQQGTLHTNINMTGTVSGRPAYSNPNLGNIPKAKDKLGLRELFIARPGHVLVNADWSSAEMRITAILANETFLLEAWANKKDAHEWVARALFGIPEPEQVPTFKRNLAKNVVYALSYGASSRKVSEMADVSFALASHLVKTFAKELPNYFSILKRWCDAATVDGYLMNPFGRVHSFTGDRIYTQSRNWIPQSTVADMMNICLCNIYRDIQGTDIHILLQIYDQIILEAPKEQVELAASILHKHMNVVWPELNNSSIPADVSIGLMWSEL